MKPDWDKLMKEYEGSSSILVADVDCTAGGKSLCESVGVRGYPTIKSGSPDDLKDYEGGRSFADLKKHAETLGPSCGPAYLELCDAEKKTIIENLMALPAEKRDAMIQETESKQRQIEMEYQTTLQSLQKAWKEEMEKKEASIAAVKNSGLSLLKSVHKFESSVKKGEL